MAQPRWLSRIVIDAIHQDTMMTHGGLPGLRNESLLESALARPRQLHAYAENNDIDICALAAAYAYGLARNHPYHDGNKRIAFLSMAVFAELNGWRLESSESEVVGTMLEVAAGNLEEPELAEWLRSKLVPINSGDSI